jgi:hypothetical protein
MNVINTTCLGCNDTLAIPAPPTALGDPALDGPKRRSRREKVTARSKVAFHEREKQGDDGGGHVLWSSENRVEQWGQAAAPTLEQTPTPMLAAASVGVEDDDDEEAHFSMS